MSLQDDLDAVHRRLDALAQKVEQLEREAARPAPRRPGAPQHPGPAVMVPVPDTPYDSTLWTDSDDEGLGARGRRAP
jgi:hypothetical protein